MSLIFRACPRPGLRNSVRARAARGFTLIELIVALSIFAVLSTIAAGQLARATEESIAQGAAVYIKTVADAAQRYAMLNFRELSAGTPVPGATVALAPTVAELVAMGRLNAGFPTGPGSVPTRQQLRVDIQRQNCPGSNCVLTALACTTTPVTLGGADTRFDLAQTMVDNQGGTGAQSSQNFGSTIRGPSVITTNPLGNVPGIVCGVSVVDTALFNRAVLIQDIRDPDLQGALTVAGTVTFAGPTTINNNLTVTGSISAGTMTVGPCISMNGTDGRAGFGCQDRDNLPAGYTGGVRSKDVVANGNILASDNPGAFTGTNGAYALVGVSGGVGEVRTSGRAAADRLTPLGSYVAGSMCSSVDEGSISRNSVGTGLVVCQAGLWSTLATKANTGDTCTPDGAMASNGAGGSMLCMNGAWQDMAALFPAGTPGTACTSAGKTAVDTANNNETLICRANPAAGPLRYMRLRDVTQHLMFVAAYEVNDGSVVTKPTCTPAAGMTSQSIIQMVAKSTSSPDGGFSIYAIDNGATWTARLRTGSNTVLLGTPAATAIAQVFCYFP